MKKIPIRSIAANQERQNSAGRFRIRSVRDLLGGKDLSQELHRHDFFFILALQKGKGTHEIDFVKYNIPDYSIFLLRPGQVHQLELKAGSTGFLMEFDTAFYLPNKNQLSRRLGSASNKNFIELDPGKFKRLLPVLTYIFNEFTTKQDGYIEIVKANLDIFFIEFIRQSQGSPTASNAISLYAQERLEELLELLEIHIAEFKQGSHYADMLNLSLYQLNTITKTTVNKTISEIINDRIILEAKRYLLATPNQVKDIAYHLGYEDVSYFIRFFRKHTGYAPDAFRRNSK